MIQDLRALVRDDLSAVQELVRTYAQTDISLLNDLAGHLLNNNGKQLRPLMLLLSAHACNYQGKDHIKLAGMIELFHAATLLHDDVIDESALRRGRQTANKLWGNKASILVGDYLFTQYMQLMLEVGNLSIMKVLTEMTHLVGRGEIKQLSNRHNPALKVQDYFEIIEAKTSLLFAAASRLGAMVAGADQSIEQALHSYGLHLGSAFQLIDDALDYCSDSNTIGKNIGDDLADGKATMPLLYALQEGSEQQKANIREGLMKGSLEYLPSILEAIESTAAIAHTKALAAFEVEKAIAYLEPLPESAYKQALRLLAEYAISRTH